MFEGGHRTSRRELLKKSAITTGALIVGGSAATGTAAAGIGDGLVGHYNLNNLHLNKDTDEKEWNHVHDASPYNNHGTNNGAELVKSGAVGKAFRFGGDDDVSVPDAENLDPGTSSWSVTFWAKPNNSDQDTAVVSKRQPSQPFPMYMVGFSDSAFGPTDTGGKRLAYRFTEDARNIDRGVYTSVDVIDEEWHHYAAVADQQSLGLRLYVDGMKKSVENGFDSGGWPKIKNSQYLYFGQDNEEGRRYNGLLDEVRIYKRALSAPEISDLADMGQD